MSTQLDYIIANGAKIEERLSGLGTILPDAHKLAIADAAADKVRARKLAEAAADTALADCDCRTVGGEVRYYRTPTQYTPAISRCTPRVWFEVRADGDYALKSK